MSHTPGPWRATRTHPNDKAIRYVDDPEGGEICTLYTSALDAREKS
jgi:hypothetical protein